MGGHLVAGVLATVALLSVHAAPSDDNEPVLQMISEGWFPPRFGAGVVWHAGALYVMGGANSVPNNGSSVIEFECVCAHASSYWHLPLCDCV
jgi:hypothetical protein